MSDMNLPTVVTPKRSWNHGRIIGQKRPCSPNMFEPSTSASEVVRVALRELEYRSKSLETLRAHLAEGANDAAASIYTKDWTIESVISDAETQSV